MSVEPTTSRERSDLCALVRRREKVAKTSAKARTAELLADFEKQLGTIYHYDNDDVWRKAMELAQSAVAESSKAIAERCAELGIPPEFAPSIDLDWYGRGENAIAKRRTELRHMATTRIAAMEQRAFERIEQHSVDLQTEIMSDGLTSNRAKTLLAKIPTIHELMPMFDASTLLLKITGRIEDSQP
jgi:hypothetical protein